MPFLLVNPTRVLFVINYASIVSLESVKIDQSESIRIKREEHTLPSVTSEINQAVHVVQSRIT